MKKLGKRDREALAFALDMAIQADGECAGSGLTARSERGIFDRRIKRMSRLKDLVLSGGL